MPLSYPVVQLGPNPVFTGQMLGPDGNASVPSYSFSSQPNTGLYWGAANNVIVANAGTATTRFSTGGLTMGASASFGWTATDATQAQDLSLRRDGANILAQRNGVNAQAHRIYNTFTDASNYERLNLQWSANTAVIAQESAGTGTPRTLLFRTVGASAMQFQTDNTSRFQITATGNLVWNTDNTLDIGASGTTRPRDLYLGRNLVVGGNATLGDASSDTLNINAGTWNIGSNFMASRAFGTLPAGLTNSPQFFSSTFTGDAGGTTDLRNYSFTTSAGGANSVSSVRNFIASVAAGAPVVSGASVFGQLSSSGGGAWSASASVFQAFISLQSTNPTAHGATFNNVLISSPTIGAGNTVPAIRGVQINNLGNAGITLVEAINVDPQANSTNHRAFRGQIAAGAGNFNLYMTGTADNALAGPLYLAQDNKTMQSVSAMYAGTGVPNNANGNNGDFYFRGDTPGTANQRLYVKSAGAWVGIL